MAWSVRRPKKFQTVSQVGPLEPTWCVTYSSPYGRGTLQIWHGKQPPAVGYVMVEEIRPHEQGTDIVVRYSIGGEIRRKVLHSERRNITWAQAVLLWRE